jgi:hypothetical protein
VVLVVEAGLRVADIGRLASVLGVTLAARSSGQLAGGGDGNLAGLSTRAQLDHWAPAWVLDRWLYDGTTSHAWVEAEGMTFDTEPVTGVFTYFGTADEAPPRTG